MTEKNQLFFLCRLGAKERCGFLFTLFYSVNCCNSGDVGKRMELISWHLKYFQMADSSIPFSLSICLSQIIVVASYHRLFFKNRLLVILCQQIQASTHYMQVYFIIQYMYKLIKNIFTMVTNRKMEESLNESVSVAIFIMT